MKGPNNKELKVSLWLGWLETISILFGSLVVVGLAMESGPEIVALLKHGTPLPRSLTGDGLVTVGVFGEVALGIFIARSAKRQEIESEKLIAEANERASEALRAAAEANLSRVRIEERVLQLSQGRQFSPDLQDDLIELLKPFAGNSVDVFLFDEHSIEASILADRIRSTFAGAGWKQKLWHCTSGRSCTGSLSIALASDLFVRQGPISGLQMLMIDLQHKVHGAGIEMIALATGFDRKKPIQPWEMKEYASWKAEEAAPLRIEVAAMQHVPFVNQISRPVTPPQT